jgi:hypothetical protein
VGNRSYGPQADPLVGAESGGDIHGQEMVGPLALALPQQIFDGIARALALADAKQTINPEGPIGRIGCLLE